ncbi:MAG: helix-turn-helix domain-containing protein [Acidobacteriia bacterium]|nr:helix-turn-helix domain-containing protein [Terriglobia bacterium]
MDLTAAQERLGKPGRPRRAPLAEQAVAMSTEPRRLLDVHASARYLGDVSVRVVHELRAAGHLRPVRLPLAGDRELRKLLFDVRDLDAFIEASKERAG